MPEQRESSTYESGRATAPPGICYTSFGCSTNEGYIHTSASVPSSANLIDQNKNLGQTSFYTQSFANITKKKIHTSSHLAFDHSPCPSPSVNHSLSVSKTNSQNLFFQSPQCILDPTSNPHNYIQSFSTPTNYSTCSINNNNNSNNSSSSSSSVSAANNNNNNIIINNSNNNNNLSNINKSSFDFLSTSKNSKCQQSVNQQLSRENFPVSSSENSFVFFDNSKYSKFSSSSTNNQSSNCSNFSCFSNQTTKSFQNKESIRICPEENLKLSKDLDLLQKNSTALKDDSEFNFGELQQFFSKQGVKLNNSEGSQDSVSDSLLHFLQKKSQDKNSQDSLSYDLEDITQILISLTNKYKLDENSGLKKRSVSEDSKLMNDFLTKIILEKEDKRFKLFDEKKKINCRENLEGINNELDEKKIKRDAMSHFQEDKSHHKRSSNYGDFSQWDYLNQQDLQTSNNHNRRSHFSFGGTSQPHSMGWNTMGMNMTRQTNPYYSNPHSHVMAAHAHAEYRYNQWNNPNNKNLPNMHNAHSQNTILQQMKHHGDISNSVQEFSLPVSPSSDMSKLNTSSLTHNSPSEKSSRPAISSLNPVMRSPSALRTSSIPSHPKTIINNPLSDLQMLVSNQETENSPVKTDNYQQESVDLSAHSEATKQKENSPKDVKTVSDNKKDLSSPISVIQTQNKQLLSDFKVCEKPVELTSKIIEKIAETEITSSVNVNSLEEIQTACENLVENKMEDLPKNVEEKNKQVSPKTSVITENEEESFVNSSKGVVIPEEIQSITNETCKEKESTKEEITKKEAKEILSENSCSDKIINKKELLEVNYRGEVSPNTEIKESLDNSKNGKRKANNEKRDKENKKAYLEVESQLEKMFKGIVEENSDLPTVSSTSAEVKSTPCEISKKTPKKKPSGKSRAVRLSSGQSSSSESHFPSKKFKGALIKDDSKKKIKKSLCEVADRRGPILHVEGSKEFPSTVTVINFPKGDDEDEKDKSFLKKQGSNATRTKHHNELDYKGKSRNGLYSSTLSARYDAHSTDHSWICVFCKKGPHYKSMGDLFGPYIISKDENNSLCDFSGDEKDISDAQKRGGRNKKSLRSNNMVEHFQKMSRKLRRAQSNESCLTGMTVISDDHIEELRYEVWVHEQCAIWSPNVCLIGSRILGMQEAIWSSIKTMCSKCGAFGANIGCVYRNCPNRSHYCCAKESGWCLEQETFISMCHIHKSRS